MQYDLVLVNPLVRFETGNNYVEYLGFSYIASYLRKKKYTVKILDIYLEGINLDEAAERLNQMEANVIGFTSMSSLYVENTKIILSKLDRKKRIYTMGGIYATQNYEHIMREVWDIDYIFLGEGEKTWNIFLNNLKNKLSLISINGIAYRKKDEIVSNGMSDFLTQEELLRLPRPAHDTLEMSLKLDGIAQIVTSRGCYGNCSFCAISNYYQANPACRWRYYDIKTCVDELEHLIKYYSVDYVDFCDEEFVGPNTEINRKRLKYFVEEIQRRKLKIKYMIYCRSNDIEESLFIQLKKSGLDRVFLGIEFGNDILLKRYGKGVTVETNIRAINILKKLNIKISVGYIMFEPLIDLKILKDNFDFYFNYCPFKLDRLTTKMGIFPNTRLYKETKEILKLNNTVWDIILGDNFEYHFIDEKVEIVYQAVNALKKILSKSKSYYRIKKSSKNQRDYDKYLQKWKDELHQKIDEFIIMLDGLHDCKLNPEEMVEDFEHAITTWDNTYLL